MHRYVSKVAADPHLLGAPLACALVLAACAKPAEPASADPALEDPASASPEASRDSGLTGLGERDLDAMSVASDLDSAAGREMHSVGADANVETLAARCPSSNDPDAGSLDVWRDALGNHTLADRGQILRCVHKDSMTLAQVGAGPTFGWQGIASNGFELFVVQYVSEGTPGVARAVTGLFYLPSGGPTNVPIAAVEHQTSGMGPSCGPTHNPAITANVALPLVGRGYAVVATDYAGMGVDNGMVSYMNGASEAAATLDAVRALRQFHDPRFDASQLSTDFFVIGHSQGGHAALFTHQYFDPAVGVSLLGSVSFAPGLGNAKDWSASFDNPSKPLGLFDAFAMMSLYAHGLYAGAPDATTWLTASARRSVPSLLHDECTDVGPSLEQMFKTQGALFMPTFLSAAASCGFTAPCPGFEPWSTELESEEPGDFASAVPALLLQGASDAVVLPAQTACIAQRLTARGTPVQACEYAGLDHFSVVPNALPDALLWMAGRRVGIDLSVCTAPLLAQCTLGP